MGLTMLAELAIDPHLSPVASINTQVRHASSTEMEEDSPELRDASRLER